MHTASTGASAATNVNCSPGGTISAPPAVAVSSRSLKRAVIAPCKTLTELAGLLGVSKQAAIKVVDEMEARGFLLRTTSADDRRVKLLHLTTKGRKVRRAALAASRRMEQELGAEIGDAAVSDMRRALEQLLARHDALADARAGRSRALW
jgi:DNA-binding MarR family transcriptional regulator